MPGRMTAAVLARTAAAVCPASRMPSSSAPLRMGTFIGPAASVEELPVNGHADADKDKDRESDVERHHLAAGGRNPRAGGAVAFIAAPDAAFAQEAVIV